MLIKILKYSCFALIILNLPATGLVAFGSSIGSLLSFATILLLLVYYFLEKKTEPNWWLLIITILYFTISGIQYIGETDFFLFELIKYLIFLVCGYELTKRITTNELYIFLLLGALSIGLEALYFTSDFGRYSGFYLNPNVAGFICIYGFSLVYGLKNSTLKLLGQFVFTLMGLLTFSRTFIVIWILLNIISLKISLKNIRILGIGFLIFTTLLTIDEVVGLNNPRFEQLKRIVNNENISNTQLTTDSRTETWALFYDNIFASPIIGNGYGTFTGRASKELGVHNTYLAIIGEAGVIPFLIFIFYFGFLFFKSFVYFDRAPHLLMLTISLSVFLLANHNFFNFYYMTFAAMWIQYQINQLENVEFENVNNLETT